MLTDLKTQTTENKTALATTLALIGAKNGDGSAFVLNLDAAKVTPTQSLAEKFTAIDATSGGNMASIKTLNEVVVGASGGTARAVLNLDVNGFVSGTVATNNGTSSDFTVIATNFKVVSDVNGTAVIPFAVQGDKAYLKNVIAENITYCSLTPMFGNEYNSLTANGGYQKFPGGFIMQWGRYRAAINRESTVSITFPIPFTQFVASVNATPYLASFSHLRDLWLQNVGAPSLTGTTFATKAARSDAQALDGFDWMAFGR